MIVETSVLLREALEHPTIGVNRKLLSIPRFDAHAEPRQVKAFLDPYESIGLAQGNVGSARPVVVVSEPRPILMEGEVRSQVVDTVNSGGYELAIAVVTDAAANRTPEALREIAYTIRAISRTVRHWFYNDYLAIRKKNGIEIRDLLEVTMSPTNSPLEGIEGLRVSGVVFVRMGIRETEPI